MTATYILSDSPRARYVTGAMMYFAQGIPQGLMGIAIPAWLASEGVSAAEIGSYLAIIVLPWAFKLVTGPFMDKYQFPPMGTRRPWIIGAQIGLTLSLLALMLIDDPAGQIGLLMLIGALVNSFAATQDVAVDGMSIDLTPVREQGRLNAFMSFGKAIGWSVTAAVSGLLLTTVGLQITAIVASAVTGLVLIAFMTVLERPGERRLPWSKGAAISSQRSPGSFRSVFGGLNQVLWTRTSVVIMLVMFTDGIVYGFGHALMPIAAIKLFSYTTQQWSQLVALMGLIGAGAALLLGPLIDRFGARQILLITVTLVAAHAFLISQTQSMWQDSLYIKVMLSIWIIMLPVVMVSIIALAMSICSGRNSATQFAIYMSTANLGISVGSKMYGMVAERSTYVENYSLLGLASGLLIIILFFHRHKDGDTRSKGKEQDSTYTIGAGGGAGVYFSGAMRCPKCRSDMEQIEIEGTEIDRCVTCNGIWFDAGEVEALRNAKLAATIDTGSAELGAQHNHVDHYRCPRCGGRMEKKVDSLQKHIWYETCSDCSGSFFDAGEFLDLSTLTVSDIFKRLVTPRRN